MPISDGRIEYPHWRCQSIPCSCQPTQYPPLQFQLLPCWNKECGKSFYTMSELQEHHLTSHSLPDKVISVFEPTPPPQPHIQNGVSDG